jgi:hypothetical protein
LNPRPLGYEPYDARLRRLAWSLVATLTSVNGARHVYVEPRRLPRRTLFHSVSCTNPCTSLAADQRHRRNDERFRVRSPRLPGLRASSQVAIPAVLFGSNRGDPGRSPHRAREGHGLLIGELSDPDHPDADLPGPHADQSQGTVLQTATTQVGLCYFTCGDACGRGRRVRCVPRMSRAVRIGEVDIAI